MDLDPGLAALRPLGGFFLLRTAGAAHGALPTLADAYDAGRAGAHPDPLDVRVRRVAGAIRAPEARVAASIAHQGLAARLWSVALGCAVLYGTLPDLDPGLLRWDPRGSAPDDLWLTALRPDPHASTAPGDHTRAAPQDLARAVLDGHLHPLAAALRARHRLAPGLLRGNAASALAGAGRHLQGWALAHDHPDAASRARALTAALLAHPHLAGAGTPTGPATGTPTGTPAGPQGFRRRSCCLYYRVPGGGVCGDCCFPRPPRSSPRAPSG
ncbi:(2Fe-2S)-binding protein [Streptomyces sp. NPDC028635]|uniref:(2Fe-2S)-binding protein n=1 Tax=Streptomyces sp. NPDC028635 TaxID=3154800 RepID=UPI0033FC23F4